jgi:hypothetical protein
MDVPTLTENTKAFYSQVILNDEFAVDEWNNLPEAVFKKQGDYLCWLMFNRRVEILDMNAEVVKVQR